MLGGLANDPALTGTAWAGMVTALPDATILFALLYARLGGILMLLPAFSDESVPGRIRMMIALAITASLYPLMRQHVAPALEYVSSGNIALASTLLTELLLGIALGLVVRIFFHAIGIAGGIISLQIGMTSALVFDPSAGGQVPVLAKFISIAALLLCMSTGVHHLWIASLVKCYDHFPVGMVAPAGDFAQLALMSARGAMALGLSLAAPIVVYGIVFNVALGLTARLAPQIQIFFIAQPLNLLLGIALTAAVLAASLYGFAHKMAEWTHMVWG